MDAYLKDLEKDIRDYEETLKKTDTMVAIAEKQKLLKDLEYDRRFLHPVFYSSKIKDLDNKIQKIKDELKSGVVKRIAKPVEHTHDISKMSESEKKKLLNTLYWRVVDLKPDLSTERQEYNKIMKTMDKLRGKARKTRRRKTKSRKASK